MKATITRVSAQTSKYGGQVWMMTFKCDDGKSRRTWLDPKNGNFKRWEGLLNRPNASLDGLIAKGDTIIDADSWPKVVTNGLD